MEQVQSDLERYLNQLTVLNSQVQATLAQVGNTHKLYLEYLFNLSSDIMGVADFDGRILLVSPSVETQLGWTPMEFTSQEFYYFVHADDHERTREAYASLSQGYPLDDFTNRYRTKSGEYVPVIWRCTADVVLKRIFFVVKRADITNYGNIPGTPSDN